MSHILTARNINGAFKDAWWWLRTAGLRERSRNGPVLVAPGTFQTEYTRPQERVLFNPRRDCNHVFHLMEAIWMLAGDTRVDWLAQFNSRYVNYADADGHVWGAYGARWRRWFTEAPPTDQLPRLARLLRDDPHSRQAVLQMWSAPDDLGTVHNDRPCNTHVYFDLRGAHLNMTVCCRSNDMLWGAYGANVVHFSILQELLAAELGVPMGVYRQFSNNFHVYLDVPQVQEFLDTPPTYDHDVYSLGSVRPVPLVAAGESMQDILDDCERFVDNQPTVTHFLSTVAAPLRDVYLARKRGLPVDLTPIPDCDWKHGFSLWLLKRKDHDV